MSHLPLIIALALAATPVLAAEPEAPIRTAAQTDAFIHSLSATDTAKVQPTIATRPAAPAAPVSTAAQIDAFLKSAPPLDVDDGAPMGATTSSRDDRVHGTVEASVGSHGYRSVYAQTDVPVGENGRLSIAVEQSRGRGPYGYGYGGGYGYGYGGYGGGYGRLDSSTRSSVGLGLSFSSENNRSDRCQRQPLDSAGQDVSSISRCEREMRWPDGR